MTVFGAVRDDGVWGYIAESGLRCLGSVAGGGLHHPVWSPIAVRSQWMPAAYETKAVDRSTRPSSRPVSISISMVASASRRSVSVKVNSIFG